MIYSEAIITKPDLTPEEQIYSNPELARARDLGIRHISYPVALGEVFNAKNGIAITGSHGKSTTTAMTGILLSNISSINNGKRNTFSEQNPQPPHSSSTAPLQKELIAPGTSVLVGTQVPQLGNSNFHFEESENFVIEACEYKRSFLQYHPYITVITNIDLDHLDYYTSLEDYISAFQSLVDQTSGFVIISADDENSQKLQIPVEKKIVVGTRMFDSSNLGILDETDSNTPALQSAAADNIPNITYYPRVEEDCCGVKKIYTVEKNMTIPKMQLQVPGEHLLHDAHLAYTVGRLLGMQDDTIVQKLESYTGSWRRSEIV